MKFGCNCSGRFPIAGLIQHVFTAEEIRESIASGCPAGHTVETVWNDKGSLYFFGGDILTMTGPGETAECLLVQDGKICWVGGTGGCPPLPASVTKVDLKGGCLIPGMIDPHVHVVGAALGAMCVDLTPAAVTKTHGVYTIDTVVCTLQEAIDRRRLPFPWLMATGFDPSQMKDWQNLDVTKFAGLRNAGRLRIMVQSGSGHISFVNQVVLDLAGIGKGYPQPDNGRIGLLEDGSPSGIFVEYPAQSLVMKAFTKVAFGAEETPHGDGLSGIHGVIGNVLADALSKGVTTLNDAALGITLGTPQLEEDAIRLARDLMHVAPRMASALFLKEWSYETPDEIRNLPEIIRKGPDLSDATFFRQAVKLIADGSNQGVTGYQVEPYEAWALSRTRDYTCVPRPDVDDTCKSYKGTRSFDPGIMTELMSAIMAHGWQIMVHANGEQAVADVVKSFGDALGHEPGPVRHRIEHCSLASCDSLQGMQKLHVDPSFLIDHTTVWGDVLTNILGETRVQKLDRCRSALKYGLTISFHSDHPVTPLGPLRMIQDAVTRRTASGKVLNASEAISAAEALYAVTMGAAKQCRIDDHVGSLEVGKLADLVVLAQSPLKVDAGRIAEIEVRSVYVGGRLKS